METTEEILARMEEAYQAASGHPAQDVSDTGLRLRVLAGELLRLNAEVEWLRRQSVPHTATGQWLDRHAAARGVTRRPAAKAQGRIAFSRYLPLSFDLTVPAGTVCATSGEDPVEYVTLQDAVLPAGELRVEAPAQAAAGGPAGNAAAGTINTMLDPPDGINYVNNPAAFTGGRAREGDESLRARTLAAYSLIPNAGNAAFYRDAALAVTGVGSVGVVPRENGAGTVGVYLWGEDGAPDQDLVDAVQARLDELREVAVTVTVQAAAAATVDVDARLRLAAGADFDQAQADIQAALEAWFAGRGVGDSCTLAQLARVILNAAPVVKLEWPVTMGDVSARKGRVPVLGTVTLEALS